MILNTLINSEKSLMDFDRFIKKEKINNHEIKCEVLLGISELSRFGTLKKEALPLMVKKAKEKNHTPVLVWDILQTEDRMDLNREVFKTLPLHDFERVRVHDPGVLSYVMENFPWLKVDLILETGNHNTLGLETWIKHVGEKLHRVILSLEIPKEKLKEIVLALKKMNPKLEVELLVFGPILLFYTPRPLLKALKPIGEMSVKELIENDITLYASGTSEESPHSGFPLIENRHGTFMFNTKDHSLVTEMKEMLAMKIDAFRFDLEVLNHKEEELFEKYFSHIGSLVNIVDSEVEKLKSISVRPLIKGFFQINKTDVLFTKLKNRTIERQDTNFVGEVIDVERDKGLCLWVKSKNKIELPQKMKLISPENKVKEIFLETLATLTGERVSILTPGEYYLVPYLNSITLKSKVYLEKG